MGRTRRIARPTACFFSWSDLRALVGRALRTEPHVPYHLATRLASLIQEPALAFQTELVAVRYGETKVSIDYCRSCQGIWLDRGEFKRIVDALESEVTHMTTSEYVKASIAEGYGRKIYKAEYLKFLIYALGSTDETKDHLETLYNTKSLQDHTLYNRLHEKTETLGKKIRNYYLWVEENYIPSL